jgi:hypothetical protein
MHVRARGVNTHCVVYSVEKTILIGKLGIPRNADNELYCRHCRQTMRITKANVDDEKRAGSSRPTMPKQKTVLVLPTAAIEQQWISPAAGDRHVDQQSAAGAGIRRAAFQRTRLCARTRAGRGPMLSEMMSLHPSFLVSERLIRESRTIVEQTARLVRESKQGLKAYTRFGPTASLHGIGEGH